jgi:hypothetical protein
MVRFGCLKGLSWAGLIILFVVQQTRNVNVASGITSFSTLLKKGKYYG